MSLNLVVDQRRNQSASESEFDLTSSQRWTGNRDNIFVQTWFEPASEVHCLRGSGIEEHRYERDSNNVDTSHNPGLCTLAELGRLDREWVIPSSPFRRE
jgi:hypothetical protein